MIRSAGTAAGGVGRCIARTATAVGCAVEAGRAATAGIVVTGRGLPRQWCARGGRVGLRHDRPDGPGAARVLIHLITLAACIADSPQDRKSVVQGKSVSVRVDLGGRRNIKKKNKSIYLR